MEPIRVNFLNHGRALNQLLGVSFPADGQVRRDALIQSLRSNPDCGDDAIDVVKAYGGTFTRNVDLRRLRDDIQRSARARDVFSDLGCRGFSFIAVEAKNFTGPKLRDDVNFRIALVPDQTLFYPPRIRREFNRAWSFNHFRTRQMPSIAFAIGRVQNETCNLSVMQSDLVFRLPAHARDHFRGWRKILFACIVQTAKQAGCHTISLPGSNDVLRSCIEFRKPQSPPPSWRNIYERTATEFGLQNVELAAPVDIQIYEDQIATMTGTAYATKLNEISFAGRFS